MGKGINAVKEQDDWQADCDCRTLMEAEQIKKDPRRLEKAQEMAKKKLEEAAQVVGSATSAK